MFRNLCLATILGAGLVFVATAGPSVSPRSGEASDLARSTQPDDAQADDAQADDAQADDAQADDAQADGAQPGGDGEARGAGQESGSSGKDARTETKGDETKGNKEKEKEKENEKEKEKNAKKVPKIDPNLAILTGRVVLKGTPPEIEELKVPDGHRDRAACAAHVRSEVLILGKSQQLKNVVVAIDEKFRPKKTPPPRVVQFDNRNCLFVPHVLATVVGSTLELKNSDPFIHNSRGLLNPIGHINTAIPPKGVVKKTLRKPGWGVMKCDFHPWMTAHLHVFRHELFDVTDAAGTYKIVNIPPGTYTFYFWHERVAFKKTVRKATLEAGKTTRLDVEIEAPTS